MRLGNIPSLFLILVLVWPLIEPCASQMMGMSGPRAYISDADLKKFCSDRGGTPDARWCYFNDGSKCDLLEFYQGRCTSRTMVEQSMWDAEAYYFLNGYEGYSSAVPYGPVGSTPGVRVGRGGTIAQPWPASRTSMQPPAGSSSPSVAVADVSSWIGQANSLYNQGKYQEALDAYNASINMDPTRAEAWYDKGNALYKLGRFDEAAASFSVATSMNLTGPSP